MIMPRLGPYTRGKVPNLRGAVLDPIALADLMGVIFIHARVALGVFDHRVVEQRLVAFELDEYVIAGGDHEFSGFFGCGVRRG